MPKNRIAFRVEREGAGMGNEKPWLLAEFPVVEYREILALQRGLVDAKARGALTHDLLLVPEHHPVFTLGHRGIRSGLLVGEDFLAARGIEVVHVERGGDVTYHGPGQAVAYPIVDLTANGWKVADFVNAIEEIMIRTAGQWGIRAQRDVLNRGVWVAGRKLGSVGIAVRREISFHGLALNVDMDLRPFTWINPCGLAGCQMTSLKKETGQDILMKDVREALALHAEAIFGVSFERVKPAQLYAILETTKPENHSA
jgi:lipoyl(octanoyl) transferase